MDELLKRTPSGIQRATCSGLGVLALGCMRCGELRRVYFEVVD